MNIFSGIEYKVLKDVNLDRKYDGIEYDSRKIKENYKKKLQHSVIFFTHFFAILKEGLVNDSIIIH